MTTRRKPLPYNSSFATAEPHVEFVRPSTSAGTSAFQVVNYDLNPLPSRRRSGDNSYFDILDTYHNNPQENDGPPPYQQFARDHASGHQQVSQPFLARPQLRTTASTGLLGDNGIIGSPPQLTSSTPTTSFIPSLDTFSNPTTSTTRPKLVTALEETSFFLGGLLTHPVESTKHFTILRHSHGLVYYKGPETSLAISIFSCKPLPPSRRLWLQLKGWSGNTGMAAKALLGSNDSWINVTPETQVSVSELQSSDERAWQRDITKFQAKATKMQSKHQLRETCVIRIPFEASDGYFRLVLTTGDSKNALCPSPVFRVASTSMSASCIKGASLTTLPLELGVRAAQTAANVAVSKVTVAATPLKMVAKDRVTNLAPMRKYGGHVQTAWEVSGIQKHVDNANQQYGARRGERPILDRTASAPELSRGGIVGDDAGPTDPFPTRLSGIVARGTGVSTAMYDMPTANLDDLPADILSSLSTGVYFGWTLVVSHDPIQTHLHESWQQAIITISFIASAASKIAQRKTIRVYIIHEYPTGTLFIGAKLKLCVMGYLRPLLPSYISNIQSQPKSQPQPQSQQHQHQYQPEQNHTVSTLETLNDISITRASLSRPNWSVAYTLARSRTARAERGIAERLVDVRIAGQRTIDRIPVHVVGVRNGIVGVHDREVYGNGGVWVKRN